MDLSVQLATVFKMSKYMKTWKNTSENYKKQILFFQKFTEPKISYNISSDFLPHFVKHISCEAKLFPFNLRENLDFGNFFYKWLGFVRIVSHPKTKPNLFLAVFKAHSIPLLPTKILHPVFPADLGCNVALARNWNLFASFGFLILNKVAYLLL